MTLRQSLDQTRALLAAAARQLAWGLPRAARQIRIWRARAQAVSDAQIRADALDVVRCKRAHIDGAALFWIVLRRRSPRLLDLLVSYEMMLDFLDYAGERGQEPGRDIAAGRADGEQMHRALLDALDPDRSRTDHWLHHPWRDDARYLAALIFACRSSTTSLPSYSRVRSFGAREAGRASEVLAINHIACASVRDAELRLWARRHFTAGSGMSWFELSAAVSGSLGVHSLFVLAADRCTTSAQAETTYAAYMPWVALSTAMFDSWADQIEDAEEGSHSYVAHYDSASTREARLEEIASETMRAVLALPDGRRHAVIVSSMIAMYLTKDAARTPELAAATRRLARAAGTLTVALVPILRAWRIVFLQRAA